jgi:RNA polymerase sigma-70 factor (ECF subfamily)
VGNLCIDRMRKHRNRPLPLESVPNQADTARTVDETLQQKARSVALQTALLALPERQRQAVILRSIEGLANPEISGIMAISVEAVESLTSRGKRALTKLLISRQAELGFKND